MQVNYVIIIAKALSLKLQPVRESLIYSTQMGLVKES